MCSSTNRLRIVEHLSCGPRCFWTAAATLPTLGRRNRKVAQEPPHPDKNQGAAINFPSKGQRRLCDITERPRVCVEFLNRKKYWPNGCSSDNLSHPLLHSVFLPAEEEEAMRSSDGSTWKSITQTPPCFRMPTPFSIAARTSEDLVIGPMPTAPWASAILAMLGNGSSMRRPIQRFAGSRPRRRATLS